MDEWMKSKHTDSSIAIKIKNNQEIYVEPIKWTKYAYNFLW